MCHHMKTSFGVAIFDQMDDIFAMLNVVNPDDRLQGILETLPEKWDSIRKEAIARQKEDPDFFFDEDGEKVRFYMENLRDYRVSELEDWYEAHPLMEICSSDGVKHTLPERGVLFAYERCDFIEELKAEYPEWTYLPMREAAAFLESSSPFETNGDKCGICFVYTHLLPWYTYSEVTGAAKKTGKFGGFVSSQGIRRAMRIMQEDYEAFLDGELLGNELPSFLIH